MKKNFLPVVFVVIFCAFFMFIPDASAVGLGIYGNLSQGSMSGTAEGSFSGNDYENDIESDISGFGLGFVLDTCVARNSLFNYRLQIGYEGLGNKFKWDTGFEDDLNLTGLAFTQDFGFGVFRASFMRLWLGPELRIAYGMGGFDRRQDWDAYFINLGIGPALGANFHLGSSPVSLAVKVSYMFESYIGAGIYDGSRDFDNEMVTGTGSSIYATFSVLFRLGDYY